MTGIKEKIIKEVEKIPKDEIAKVYDFVHLFRMGIESQRRIFKDKRHAALKFFGIWKNMSDKEKAALEDIQLRRQRTYRERAL